MVGPRSWSHVMLRDHRVMATDQTKPLRPDRVESFQSKGHPFAWTTAAERDEVLANVNDPIWARFLDEASAHFARVEKPAAANFPVFCHDGDLDEVMALSVLAYVNGDRVYWEGIADWLRSVNAYFNTVRPQWEARMTGLLAGAHVTDGNPRAVIDCFTSNGMYWVEAGFMSSVLHLYDLLEAEAPDILGADEKRHLEEALSHFAIRYAFHEEALKYSNRGLWANAGVLIASLMQRNPETARVLQHRAHRRYEEYRSTFLNDGTHAEGAPGYHGMSCDGLLCFTLIASHVWPEVDYFGATAPDPASPFSGYPGFADLVHADLKTLMPAPVPMYNPRGVSTYQRKRMLPSMLHAYRMTRDSELGWLIQQVKYEHRDGPQKLPVTPHTALGLGQYTPLLNFWLYREVTDARAPAGGLSVLPDHGSVFSRSGWEADADCVWARFGYEGTGKGHRDCEHVGIVLGGRQLLADPFPRVGPTGHDSSIFHNTVTIDCTEPPPTIGRLLGTAKAAGATAFLLHNSGGQLPNRAFLHDPRDESHYWFTKQPVAEAPFTMKRAVAHIQGQCAILVDSVERPASDLLRPCIDWFFHSDFRPEGYDRQANVTREFYQLRPTIITQRPRTVAVEYHGPGETLAAQRWHSLGLGDVESGGRMHCYCVDADLVRQAGHRRVGERANEYGGLAKEQVVYFLRLRTQQLAARVIWVFTWGREAPKIDVASSKGDAIVLEVRGDGRRYRLEVAHDRDVVRMRES